MCKIKKLLFPAEKVGRPLPVLRYYAALLEFCVFVKKCSACLQVGQSLAQINVEFLARP